MKPASKKTKQEEGRKGKGEKRKEERGEGKRGQGERKEKAGERKEKPIQKLFLRTLGIHYHPPKPCCTGSLS